MPFLILLASLLLALPVALFSPGTFLRGFLAAFILLFLVLLGLWAVWCFVVRRWVVDGRKLALYIALVFLLRLGGGIALSQAFQAWGYDKEVYHRGYLFPDAMERDLEAYQVALSGVPLIFNDRLVLDADQYGGMSLFSAAVYRLFSPDAHRPHLILILAAACFALGLPFLQQAVRQGWGERLAAPAVWIYLLYPDGIFFTASQMREPFIIGLSAVVFWSAVALRGKLPWSPGSRGAGLAGLLALLAILPISPPAAAFIALVFALSFWIDFTAGRTGAWWKWIGLAGFAGGALVLFALTWNFFREAAGWDAVLAETSSGMLSSVIDQLGDRLRLPFITVYGLAQPVLPAAIFEPSIPLMKTLILLRSLGWYALLPLLVYAVVAVRHAHPGPDRLRALWLALTPWVWLAISSARAGGDMSDNPRYRLILLVLLSVSAAWAWMQAREHRDPWLGRILIIEGLFLLLFIQWYAARYVHFLVKLPFITMLALIAAGGFLVVAGGLLYDRLNKNRLSS